MSGALRLGEEGGGARVARPWSGFAPWLVLLLDFALLAGLAAEGSVLTQRGGARYLLEPAVALLAYLAVVILTARRGWRSAPTRVALIAGMLTAVMWMISLTVETFAGLSGWPSIAATGPLLLGAFVVWGAVGAVAGRRTGELAAGVQAAIGAAMLCVSVTVAYGWALVYLALPTLEQDINGSPEYLASHWGDLHAFAVANSLDAGATHLLFAPVIAAVTGWAGALVATRSRPAHPRAVKPN